MPRASAIAVRVARASGASAGFGAALEPALPLAPGASFALFAEAPAVWDGYAANAATTAAPATSNSLIVLAFVCMFHTPQEGAAGASFPIRGASASDVPWSPYEQNPF